MSKRVKHFLTKSLALFYLRNISAKSVVGLLLSSKEPLKMNIVKIEGPRRSGKTTLLSYIYKAANKAIVVAPNLPTAKSIHEGDPNAIVMTPARMPRGHMVFTVLIEEPAQLPEAMIYALIPMLENEAHIYYTHQPTDKLSKKWKIFLEQNNTLETNK